MRGAIMIPMLAAVVSAGCGGTTTSSVGSGDALAEAADKTATESSSRFRVVVEGAGMGSTTAEGVVAFHASAIDASVREEVGTESYSYELMVSNASIYFRPGDGLPKEGPSGKHWFKSSGGFDRLGAAAREPADLLRFLRDTTGAEDVGADDVRGVQTEHYRARIDFDKALADLPSDDREKARNAVRLYDPKLLGEGLPLDVWIDGDGRVRKLQAADDTAASSRFSATVELFDFGVAQPKPPPNDVVDEQGAIPYQDSQLHAYTGTVPAPTETAPTATMTTRK